jgi:hypothetical protein
VRGFYAQLPQPAIVGVESCGYAVWFHRLVDASSNGRCNTIWYIAAFKGGVYETRETVWVFGGAETRRVASLEGRADAA